MKKIVVALLLMFAAHYVQAQLNNSWIDYNKTYYKFHVSKTGLYRINQSVLSSIGLSNIPAEQFQLWRNGEQVRLFTSAATGALGAGGYIEFWGKMNDGVSDKTLYIKPGYQLCDSFSLFTDTAAYFLTVNPAVAQNLRFTTTVNNVAGNTLTAEKYFMRTVAGPYKSKLNGGYAVKVGEFVYSSSYELGEGWTSFDAAPGAGLDIYKEFYGLNVYTAGPPNSVSFYVSAFGNALNMRNFRVKFFGNTILDMPMNFFDTVKTRVDNLSLSLLQNPNYLQIAMNGTSSVATDRVVVADVQVTYPATFNFNNEKQFYFNLPASANGNYVVIDNFNYGASLPVLYSLTDGKRFVGDTLAGKVRFALPGSTEDNRKFLLVNEETNNITNVTALTTRNFVDYNLPANQGNYVIISNPILYNDGSGNNYVEQYRQYRSTANGGSYNTKIVSIDELTDQFGFGISKHPAAIRDFIRFANAQFNPALKYVFIIGRGVNASEARTYETDAVLQRIDMVPTFGWPASDVMLACEPGTYVPLVPIGRLAAVTGTEIKHYLDKVIEYETVQRDPLQTIANKAWMKNIVHVIGGSDSIENAQFTGYMNTYKRIVEDSLFGGKVETFVKSSTSAVEQASGDRIEQLINEGVSEIGYFGHSSANTLAFNLSSPEVYTNAGKYPFFNVSGCSAGNFFTFDPGRLANNLTISEKYVLAERRGSIAFIASTHLGIPPFLHFYNTELYNNYSRRYYGNTLGNIIRASIAALGSNSTSLNYYTRVHLEEINLHGDPAIKVNNFASPDYTVEEANVKVSPNLISVADNSFDLSIKTFNIGKAVNDSIRVLVTRKLSNDSVQVLYDHRIKATLYSDSFNLVIPINPITDKGRNLITVTVDADNAIDEMSETNNSVTKEFFIYEDEIRPVTPYNYAIVNQSNIVFTASTANPLVTQRQFVMQIDTTELFNSPFKKEYTVTGNGGLIQFTPTNITYTDGTVYYWRTSMVPLNNTQVIWNNFSFVYLPNSSDGFNQSHYFQHKKSTYSSKIKLDADRVFRYTDVNKNLIINTGLYPAADYDRIDVNLDFDQLELYGCIYNSLQFMVYDSLTLQPWKNFNYASGTGRFGSWPICSGPTRNSFEFPYTNALYRKRAMDFLDSIPAGMFVSITNLGNANSNNTFISDWQADQNTLGAGNSLYHKLKAMGFDKIDSFTRNLPFVYFFKKGSNTFPKREVMGSTSVDLLSESIIMQVRNQEGVIESPAFGPARSWSSLHWRGESVDAVLTDNVKIEVVGVKATGENELLRIITPATDTSLAFVNANTYPYLKLRMQNTDRENSTPQQLTYWRINADLLPEGAVAPNIWYKMKDTVEQGETVSFELAFKNISTTAFDSLKVKLALTDKNNVTHFFSIPKQKALQPNDTVTMRYQIDTRNYPGANTLNVVFNPEEDQPEQYLFNNFMFKDLYVREDRMNPLLDVTFDGIHILSRDIVAAKPNILIRLKDESRFLALQDTALLKVMVRYPDGTLHNYYFDQNMRFNPATLSGGDNTASIDFNPTFTEDGEYELIVTGRDVVGNKAGNIEYKVVFSVINTPMISNLLNYPNPFTTSTAFVFTITGSEVPQNLRIQILTITGKVVKEITKAELTDLHVGRNITEYKWDGTDMYGQQLANGVYLYRVITNLNGKSLDKYRSEGEKTDQYFKA
ncbi:MAG: hypothetical protein RLY16_134, partial [Bacteroidota bacterium]